MENLNQILAGRYKLGDVIAAGGMGVVVSAIDLPNARAVVVKFMHTGLMILHIFWLSKSAPIGTVLASAHFADVRNQRPNFTASPCACRSRPVLGYARSRRSTMPGLQWQRSR
jgi:hypothetical protein